MFNGSAIYTSITAIRMTSHQISLIRQSWPQILLIRDLAGQLFYQRLFELNPALRRLFPEDLQPQRRKLLQMLHQIVSHLDKLDTFLPQIQALGRRHSGYGAEPAHYQQVGEALLWTLDRGLGTDWTAELAEAWTIAIQTLASVMIAAQQEAAPTPEVE